LASTIRSLFFWNFGFIETALPAMAGFRVSAPLVWFLCMDASGISLREVAFGSDVYGALLAIRDEVLRKPIGMVLRDKDTATDHAEFHLAAFDQDKAVGCVLLKPLGKDVIQLRQMAILDSHRGRKIGKMLVDFAERFASGNGFSVVETRARRTARGFYEKLGYHSVEEEFADEHTLKMRKGLV
jgi:GNAT superfamily N-acetyltransferase